jgi:hypothetical protein
MTEKQKSIVAFFAGLLFLIYLGIVARMPASSQSEQIPHFTPGPPKTEYSVLRTGPLEVAKIFGRAQGCFDADPELIETVSTAAIRTNLDPKLVAATVAVESGCDSLAISNRGAVGLMQVRPVIWKDKFDFTKTYNLFNLHDNVQVGTEILSGLVQQFGTHEGIRRYQGLGPGGDGLYVEKILSLAGRK